MKTMNRKMKKGLAMLTAASMLAGMLSVMSGSEMVVQAADNTPSVRAFATPVQLMDSGNFALHGDEGSGVAQKVYFGTNGTQKQTWYIAGSDAADSIVLLCDPELPMAVSTKFEDDSGNNKEYKEEWKCAYGTEPIDVYPNHYGASDLRLTTLKGLETSAFTTSEQLMMQSTTIHTMDTKNSSTYSTTDKLYAAYGDSDANYITVGANSAESLNEGIKVSLTSTPYYRKKAFKLRPPYNSPDTVLAMYEDWCGNQHVDKLSSVLPAFRLNLSSVLFASAASAASSDTAMYGVLAEDTAMMLRLDGSSKAIGNVVYNPVKKLLVAAKDDGATDPVSLVVQGNDGEKNWYYSKKITDAQSIKASEIKSALGLSSEVDLLNCKFWMETTIDGVTYAKINYSTATTSVSSVALSGIAAPVAQNPLDAQASTATEHLKSTTPAIVWKADGNEVTGNADYDTTYTATITLDTVDTAYFDANVTATVNGQSAAVAQNVDGTITVSLSFPATAKGNISHTATGYEDNYDGQAHGIEVTVSDPAGVSVSYSTDGTDYNPTAPTYTNAGEYTVYYKLEKAKYETVTGSKTVKINKSTLTITASDQTITYDKSIDESAYTVTGLAAGDSIENIILTPSTADITDSGSIVVSMDRIVNAQGVDVTDNYGITCTDGVLIIGNGILSITAVGYEGVYDGQPHGITVSADGLEGVTITYSEDGGNYSPTNPTYTNVGEYTVYYKLEKANYETVTDSKIVKINKRPLTITASNQTITYGDSIDESAYSVSGLLSGDRLDTITLTPSTTAATNCGSIAVSMDKVVNTGGVDVTDNYDITFTAGTLVIGNAVLPSTAVGYEGVYDGQPHGITVNVTAPTDATITYSVDGITYSSTAPTYTNVGEYTVYYKIEKPNYDTVTGSQTVKITAVPQVNPDDSQTTPESKPESTPAPTPAPAPEEPEVTEITYTIAKGDTLSKIAKKYDCTVNEIVAMNKDLIKNPNRIRVGWKLRIPEEGVESVPQTPEDGEAIVYVIKKGDSLWKIAREYHCSIKELVSWNSRMIKNPNRIYAGWQIKIFE